MRYKRKYISNKGVLIHRLRKESDTMTDEECQEVNGDYSEGICTWIEETKHNFLFDYERVRKETVNEYGIATRTSSIKLKTDTIAPYQEEDMIEVDGEKYSITIVEDMTKNEKGNRRSVIKRKVYYIEAT